jgi:hypothetical protein
VRRIALFAGAALFLCALPARADERKACIDAADKGQTLRDEGKLVEARESFVACAREACPAIVATHCATWLADVRRETPTVSFRATDGSGSDLVDVQVSVDGVPTLPVVDGRAVPIDPGVHQIRFSHIGAPDIQQEVVVHAGEKLRPIDVRFATVHPAPVSPAPSSESAAQPHESEPSKTGFRFPLLAGVSLGVGAASFIAMGILVGSAASDVDHLRATCAGSCPASEVSSANTRIVFANVAMGIGIAAVATAAVSLVVVNVGHGQSSTSQALVVSAGPGSMRFGLMF